MSVPFTSIGAGQSARAVYQIMGSSGPINNPAGIRYLPIEGLNGAGAITSALGGASVLSGGGALIAMGLLAANVAISTVTLVEVRKIRKRIDRVESKIDEISSAVKEIATRVERIDIAVAESHLREALKAALRNAAVSDTEIDLEALEVLEGDLDRFLEPLGVVTPGVHSSLRLASDVREMLLAIKHLLTGARLHTWATMNQFVDGDPHHVMSQDAFELDVWPNLEATVALANVYAASLGNIDDTVIGSFIAGFRTNEESGDPRYATTNAIEEVFNELMPYESNLVAELLSEWDFDRSFEEQKAFASEFLQLWRTSDACLVWDVWVELKCRNIPACWPNSTNSRDLDAVLEAMCEPTAVDFQALADRVTLLERSGETKSDQ